MTAPSSGRDDATVRGAVVLVVAIVIGLALLARGGGGGGDDDEQADATPTSAETASTEATGDTGDDTTVPVGGSTPTDSSVPTDTLAPADVMVVVLNATDTVGWAGQQASTLASAGFQTGEANVPVGANTDTSAVYATPEAQGNAQAVIDLLALPNATISPMPTESLARNGEDAGADIVVVLGSDSLGG